MGRDIISFNNKSFLFNVSIPSKSPLLWYVPEPEGIKSWKFIDVSFSKKENTFLFRIVLLPIMILFIFKVNRKE
jgi:hypothetical protein